MTSVTPGRFRISSQLHVRSKKRKFFAAVAAVLAIVGWVGLELMGLQSGLRSPTPEAIAAAAAEDHTRTPPAPIGEYQSISVPVEGDVVVTVHLREDDAATDNLFLVHGAGGGAWVWEEYFSLMPEQYNLYAISWRGHFTSSPVEDADTADYVADQLAAIEMITRRNDLPVHVIGHSYGGATSVLAADEAPQHVESLHLLAPVVPLDYSFVQATVAPIVVPPILDSSASTEEQAIRSGDGPVGAYVGMFLSQAQMDRYWDSYAGQPFSIEKRSLIAVDGISPDWQDKLDNSYRSLGERGVPVWFLTSPYDNVVAPAEQLETATEIGATVVELESGHYIPLDVAADESVAIVLENLDRR